VEAADACTWKTLISPQKADDAFSSALELNTKPTLTCMLLWPMHMSTSPKTTPPISAKAPSQ